MVLFVLRKPILQTRMCSHPVVLDVWLLVGPFVYFHTSRVRTAKALARLPGCAGSPEPSLVAYVITTIISWAGSTIDLKLRCLSCSKLNVHYFKEYSHNRDQDPGIICHVKNESRHEKTCLCHMRTTKAQISDLRIRAVWSAPLLSAA